MRVIVKRSALIMLIFILSLAIPTLANERKESVPIFMGRILEVSKDEKNESIRVMAKGYIKGCSVYEEELLLIITEKTKIMPNKCGENDTIQKDICVGDIIFAKLNEAMTKSIPPQVVAKSVQISKVNN